MMSFGTSGFNYDERVGNFYPRGMPKREWLTYYAREFDTCEVNSTFIFANNHWRGQAVGTIRQLRLMLD